MRFRPSILLLITQAGLMPLGCQMDVEAPAAPPLPARVDADAAYLGCGQGQKQCPIDGDGDGLSYAGAPTQCVPVATTCPSLGDCDDGDPDVHPGAEEICGDGIDQDCVGGDAPCIFVDADGDGFTVEMGDCDDADPEVHPYQAEDTENGIDDDCDGAIDEPLIEYITIAIDGEPVDDGYFLSNIDPQAPQDVEIWLELRSMGQLPTEEAVVGLTQTVGGVSQALADAWLIARPPTPQGEYRYWVFATASVEADSGPNELLFELESPFDGSIVRQRLTLFAEPSVDHEATLTSGVGVNLLQGAMSQLQDRITAGIVERLAEDSPSWLYGYEGLTVDVDIDGTCYQGNSAEGEVCGRISGRIMFEQLSAKVKVDDGCYLIATLDDVGLGFKASLQTPTPQSDTAAGDLIADWASASLGTLNLNSWFDGEKTYYEPNINGQLPWDWQASRGDLAVVVEGMDLYVGGTYASDPDTLPSAFETAVEVDTYAAYGHYCLLEYLGEEIVEDAVEETLGTASGALHQKGLLDSLRHETLFEGNDEWLLDIIAEEICGDDSPAASDIDLAYACVYDAIGDAYAGLWDGADDWNGDEVEDPASLCHAVDTDGDSYTDACEPYASAGDVECEAKMVTDPDSYQDSVGVCVYAGGDPEVECTPKDDNGDYEVDRWICTYSDPDARGLSINRFQWEGNALEYFLNDALHYGLPTKADSADEEGVDTDLNLDLAASAELWDVGLWAARTDLTGSSSAPDLNLYFDVSLADQAGASSESYWRLDPRHKDGAVPTSNQRDSDLTDDPALSLTLAQAALNRVGFAVADAGLLQYDDPIYAVSMPIIPTARFGSEGDLLIDLRGVRLTLKELVPIEVSADATGVLTMQTLSAEEDGRLHGALKADGSKSVVLMAKGQLELKGNTPGHQDNITVVPLREEAGYDAHELIQSRALNGLDYAVKALLKSGACYLLGEGAPDPEDPEAATYAMVPLWDPDTTDGDGDGFADDDVDQDGDVDDHDFCAGTALTDTYLFGFSTGQGADSKVRGEPTGFNVLPMAQGLSQLDLELQQVGSPDLFVYNEVSGAEIDEINLGLTPEDLGTTMVLNLGAVLKLNQGGEEITVPDQSGVWSVVGADWMSVDSTGQVTIEIPTLITDDRGRVVCTYASPYSGLEYKQEVVVKLNLTNP